MKKLIAFAVLAALAGAATAQEQGRVISSTPIIQQFGIPQQVCSTETVYNGQRKTGAGAVLGAIAGGAAGNAIGGGSGRAAATAIGVIGGALLGNEVEGPGTPRYDNVQHCVTETRYENRTVGYDVIYEYAGRQYSTRTTSDPGAWIALTVQPAANVQGRIYSSQPNTYAQPGVISTRPVQPSYVAPPPPPPVINYNDSGRPYYPYSR